MNRRRWDKAREATDADVSRAISELERLRRMEAYRTCLVHVAGGQDRQIERAFDGASGVAFRHTGSVLPGWLSWLRLIPSRIYVIEITSAARMREILEHAIGGGIVEVNLASGAVADMVVAAIRNGEDLDEIHEVACQDRQAVVYMLDSNNPASSTDMFSWVIVGDDVPQEVRDRLTASHPTISFERD